MNVPLGICQVVRRRTVTRMNEKAAAAHCCQINYESKKEHLKISTRGENLPKRDLGPQPTHYRYETTLEIQYRVAVHGKLKTITSLIQVSFSDGALG